MDPLLPYTAVKFNHQPGISQLRVSYEINKCLEAKAWLKAASHHNGKGLGEGLPYLQPAMDAKRQLERAGNRVIGQPAPLQVFGHWHAGIDSWLDARGLRLVGNELVVLADVASRRPFVVLELSVWALRARLGTVARCKHARIAVHALDGSLLSCKLARKA